MQPEYHKSSYKLNAREQNAIAFRRLTNTDSIPKDRQYWTLCNSQPLDSGSEIVQMVDLGLLTKGQFHGVDRDEEIIKQNKVWHPTANWHFGDWIDVIEDYEDFNPAMIYLDTTSFIDHHIAAGLTVRTMMICPPNTLLIVNSMLNDPRSSRKFDPKELLRNIERQVPAQELKKWNKTVENFDYSATGRTVLETCFFYKG